MIRLNAAQRVFAPPLALRLSVRGHALDRATHSHGMVLQLISRCWTWLGEQASSKLQDALLAAIAAGPVPRHVAFVMDGNRRDARANNKQVRQGPSDGFLALKRVRARLA